MFFWTALRGLQEFPHLQMRNKASMGHDEALLGRRLDGLSSVGAARH